MSTSFAQLAATPGTVAPDPTKHVNYTLGMLLGVDDFNQEFAYLQDGNWMFAASLPPMYPGFDLYNAYVVVLDAHVFEPWMHHHYYVAHYPRNYYHSVYNVNDTREVRGFNENAAAEIRLREPDRARIDELMRRSLMLVTAAVRHTVQLYRDERLP